MGFEFGCEFRCDVWPLLRPISCFAEIIFEIEKQAFLRVPEVEQRVVALTDRGLRIADAPLR